MTVDSVELTTVADDLVVLHLGDEAIRFEGLSPDTEYDLHGVAVRTLPRPGGELLARVATVNDLHFGERECGRIDGRDDGPIVRPDPGEPPYPEVMNSAAAAEIAAIEPAAVVVKGDLSTDGTDDEWDAFERCYSDRFGDRLHVVGGNHDSYRSQTRYTGDQWIEVPGLSVALLDTVMPTQTPGDLRPAQLEWAEDHVAGAGHVLLMGHHNQWIPESGDDVQTHSNFGLQPGASNAIDAICARHRNVLGYAAGHTHRHRRRTMRASGAASIEVGCVKDFPGSWAEYRVYEGGVMQVVHRISQPEALRWSNRCRGLYADFGVEYETYAMGALADRCFLLSGASRLVRAHPR